MGPMAALFPDQRRADDVLWNKRMMVTSVAVQVWYQLTTHGYVVNVTSLLRGCFDLVVV